ncbi:recombinase family protein [Chloroflexota bacterium]
MKTAAIYCRVSTEDQEREGTSLDSQREACLLKAKEMGYDTSNDSVFLETYSGLSLERPKLEQLRQLVRDKQVGVVIAYTLDRLSRDPVHLVILQEEMEKSSIQLSLVTETLDSSDMGKLITYIKGYAAKLEAEKIRERTMRGIKERVKAGRLPGGRKAKIWGYDYLPGKGVGEGVRYINENEAHWVREIYRWFVEDGLTLNGIIYRLRSLNVISPSGNDYWCKAALHKILKRTAYTGRTYALTQSRIKGKVMIKPREEWIEIPNATPPIISDEIFNQAQLRFKRNRELSSRNNKGQFLLSGYVFCQRCGRRYYGSSMTKIKGPDTYYYRYYRCPRNYKIVSPITCNNQACEANLLEELVWKRIEELLSKPEVIQAGLEAKMNETNKPDTNVKEREAILLQLRHLEKEKDRTWKAFELTGDETKFTREIKGVMGRVEELERRKLELESRIEVSQQEEVDIQGISRFCELAKENLSDFSFEEKRLALEALRIRVLVNGSAITVEGAIPIPDKDIVSTIV